MLNTIKHDNRKEIWCTDFNAHNSLWESKHTDNNGNVVQELLEEISLVCLNDGKGTRLDIHSLSSLYLTLVSRNFVCSSEWNVDDNSSIGSDHFPILYSINLNVFAQERYKLKEWCFEKADWDTFREYCIEQASSISMDGNIEECASVVTNLILNAALKSIPISSITGNRKVVPWWNEECTKAVRERNRALRVLRSNLNQGNLIDYQRKKALTRRIIKTRKNDTWREYCGTIGK